MPPSQIDEIVHEDRKTHKMWLGRLLERFNFENLSHKAHLLKDESDELIAELARKRESVMEKNLLVTVSEQQSALYVVRFMGHFFQTRKTSNLPCFIRLTVRLLTGLRSTPL